MRRVPHISALLLAGLATGLFSNRIHSQPSAQSPAVPEIIFRLDSGNPLEIQPGVQTGLESALWTDTARAFLKLLEVPDFRKPAPHPSGIYSRSDGVPTLLTFETGLTPSEIAWSEQDKSLYFELTNDRLESLGVFQSLRGREDPDLFWHNDQRVSLSGLQTLRAGVLAARERLQSGQQTLSLFDPQTENTQVLIQKGSPLATVTPFSTQKVSFLFFPQASPSGEFLGIKVRTESGADFVLLWQWSETLQEWSIVRQLPVNEKSSSSFFQFVDNSFRINDSGAIAIAGVPKMLDGQNKRRSFFIISNNDGSTSFESNLQIQEVTPLSDLGPDRRLMNFYPGFNNNSQIVFRVQAPQGEELWLFEDQKLKMLVGPNTRLKTDLGDARLHQSRQNKLSFFQSPQINQNGEILFGALLKSQSNGQNIGLGFFKLATDSH